MVSNAMTWINAFPPEGGVSTVLSPRTVLTGERFDYEKHCRNAFGAYAQVHDEPTPSNSQFAPTSGAICLGPASNWQDGYHFLHLISGQKITRRKWTELPIPKEVITSVDALGKMEGEPKLLTFLQSQRSACNSRSSASPDPRHGSRDPRSGSRAHRSGNGSRTRTV